jgi:hypothetical protein
LINLIIERGSYDSEESFAVLTANVLANAIPEAHEELLQAILLLVRRLASLPRALQYIVDADGAGLLFAVTRATDRAVQMEALDILTGILKESFLPVKTVDLMLAGCAPLITKGDSEIRLRTLLIMAMLLKTEAVYSTAKDHPELVKALVACFSSDNPKVVAGALRLAAAFLRQEDSFGTFRAIGTELLPLLMKDDEVAGLAAVALTVLVYSDPFTPHPSITDFLTRAVKTVSTLTIPGLQLSGVISGSFAGSQFLDENNIVAGIAKLIRNENEEIRRLAHLVIASISAMYPVTTAALDALPVLFESLQDPVLSPYPLIAITNFAVNPSLAVAAAPHLQLLVAQLEKRDRLTRRRVLTAIHRILTTGEALSHITSTTALSELVKATVEDWDRKETAISIFEMLDHISGVAGCRSALAEAGIQKQLEQRLANITVSDRARPLLMRILSRIGKG